MQEKEMTEGGRKFWDAGVDWKRFSLCVRKKIWLVAAAAVLGALLAGGVYALVRLLSAGGPQYRAEVLFAIRYNVQEEDETLKAFINEYNAYTWGDVMRSDKVVPAVLEAVPELSREEAEACLDTSIASDPEFLDVGFTTGSEELSNRVRDAYIQAMEAFGKTMADRGLTAIEAWKVTPAEPVTRENRVLYAVELGAILGFLAGVLLLAGYYVLDDSVFLAEDVTRCYPYPVLGYRTKSRDTYWEDKLKANLYWLSEKCAAAEVSLEEAETGEDFGRLRAVPAVIGIPWGTPCLRRLGPVLETLRLQDVQICGFVITEADGHFLNLYYGLYRRGKRSGGGNIA